jgi:hypothetical protein
MKYPSALELQKTIQELREMPLGSIIEGPNLSNSDGYTIEALKNELNRAILINSTNKIKKLENS